LKDVPAEPSVIKRSNGELSINGQDLLLVEIAGALEAVLYRPRNDARQRFIDAVKGLKWNDHNITEVVQTLVAAESINMLAPATDICKVAREWVANGFSEVPTGSKQFNTAWEAVNERLSRQVAALGCNTRYPELAVLQVLKRYQDHSEIAASKNVARREQEITTKDEAILNRAVAQVERALGVPVRQRKLATRSVRRKGVIGPTHVCGAGGSGEAAPPSVPLPNVPSHRVEK
jgi:hypothetical protein